MPLEYNVCIWNGTREVYIDADGTEHDRPEHAEIFDDVAALAIAKQYHGKVVDAWDD